MKRGQVPSLAGGLVAKALEESNDKYTAALARTGNMTDALLQIIAGSLSRLGEQEARLSRQEAVIRQLMGPSHRVLRPTISPNLPR